MTLWLVLFIIGTIVLLVLMFSESLGDQLPSSCPRCGAPDESIGGGVVVGAYIRWYRPGRGGRLQCRHCSTLFKNHPNGTFVEDRDS
jgi:hypothetical protein